MRKEISWTASVVDKQTGKRVWLTQQYATKKEFMDDLKRNGYTYNPNRIKPTDVFYFIVKETNCYLEDWKKYKKIEDCVKEN